MPRRSQYEDDEVGDGGSGRAVSKSTVGRTVSKATVGRAGEATGEHLTDSPDERRGGELDVLFGEFTGLDAVAHGVREGRCEGAAQHESFGVDRGVDRFGEQGVGEGGIAQRTAGEGVDHRGHPVGTGSGCGRGRHGLDLPLAQFPEDPHHEIGLVDVVPVDAAGGDAGPFGDR